MSEMKIKKDCLLINPVTSRVVFSAIEEIPEDSLVIYRKEDIRGTVNLGPRNLQVLHRDDICLYVS